MSVFDPYGDVDWTGDLRVQSCAHNHPYTEGDLWSVYDYGIRHFAPSHYRRPKNPSDSDDPTNTEGSAPMWPLADWWSDMPGDVIESPNTEALGPGVEVEPLGEGYWSGHVITLGSLYASGGKGPYEDDDEIETGTQLSFGDFVQAALDGLQYPDAGGLFQAHSGDLSRLLRRFDTDERFLGIEMYNNHSSFGFYLPEWDAMLATGRRVLSTTVADRHGDWTATTRGRSTLLAKGASSYECLRAYRRGAFYNTMQGTDLGFQSIVSDDDTVTVQATGAAELRFWTERGLVKTVAGNAGTYEVPEDTVFVRVEAVEDDTDDPYSWSGGLWDGGDLAFSQPIMYRTQEDLEARRSGKRILLLGS